MKSPKLPNHKIEELIGEGTIGHVYRAIGPDDEPCAVKVFKPHAINRNLLTHALELLTYLPGHTSLIDIKDFRMTGTETFFFASTLHADALGDEENPDWRGSTIESRCGTFSSETAWDVILQIARGLAHLHKYGIIHCSIKPSNIMLEDGESPQIKITDFAQGYVGGLDHIEIGDFPFYASPEQLRHPERILGGQGQRWDVYSFGVLAYRILTGVFPRANDYIVASRTRMSGPDSTSGQEEDLSDPAAFADRIEKEQEVSWPAPPASKEEEELRAVITRCLDLDPWSRLVDMREAADELNAILQKREIAKLADTIAVSKGKSRSSFIPYALATLTTLLLLGAVGIGIHLYDEKETVASEANEMIIVAENQRREDLAKAEEDIKAALLKSEEARADAAAVRENLGHSQASAQQLFETLIAYELPGAVPPPPLEESLKGTLATHGKFLSESEGNLELSDQRAQIYNQVGQMQMVLGNKAAASTALLSEQQILKTLAADGEGIGGVQQRLARSYLLSGKLQEGADAVQAAEEIVARLEELPDEEFSRIENQRLLGKAHNLMGRGYDQLRNETAANASFAKAYQTFHTITEDPEATEEDRYLFATAAISSLKLTPENENIANSAKILFDAIERLLALSDARPEFPAYRFQLARAYSQYADLASGGISSATELDCHEEAIKYLFALTDQSPLNKDYKFHLAVELSKCNSIKRDLKPDASILKDQLGAIDIMQAIADTRKDLPEYQFRLAEAKALLSNLYGDAGNNTAAKSAGLDAASILELLIKTSTSTREDKRHRVLLADVYQSTGHFAEQAKDKTTAKNCFAKAVQHWKMLQAKYSADREVNEGLAWSEERLKNLR